MRDFNWIYDGETLKRLLQVLFKLSIPEIGFINFHFKQKILPPPPKKNSLEDDFASILSSLLTSIENKFKIIFVVILGRAVFVIDCRFIIYYLVYTTPSILPLSIDERDRWYTSSSLL